MGTSAHLAVRYKGTTRFLYAHNDAHTLRVLAILSTTLAAAGSEAVKQRLDSEFPITQPRLADGTFDEAEARLNWGKNYLHPVTFMTDRVEMGSQYASACAERGTPPVFLEEAKAYSYGNPDFSHGGIASLFAPRLDWLEDSSTVRIEDARFVLDLDKGILLAPLGKDFIANGSYDKGEMEALWEIPLAAIDAWNPLKLLQAWQGPEMGLDEDLSLEGRRQAMAAFLNPSEKPQPRTRPPRP